DTQNAAQSSERRGERKYRQAHSLHMNTRTPCRLSVATNSVDVPPENRAVRHPGEQCNDDEQKNDHIRDAKIGIEEDNSYTRPNDDPNQAKTDYGDWERLQSSAAA